MKSAYRLFIFIATLTVLLYQGCEPVDNTPAGDDVRDPFVGVWQFYETGFKSTLAQSYIVSITKDPSNSSQVILKNFGNPGTQDVTVIGLVTASQIVVSSQSMSTGWTAEGSGKFNNVAKTTMAWTYSLIIAGSKEYHTATATRQ